MELTSFIQTVELTLHTSTNKFLTMKVAPPRLDDSYYTTYGYCTRKQVLPDKTTYWEASGLIKIVYSSGDVEVYYPKPTLQDVICDSDAVGEYYRLHPDGSVEHGYDDHYYFWGKSQRVEWNMVNIEVADKDECSCEMCHLIRLQSSWKTDPKYWTYSKEYAILHNSELYDSGVLSDIENESENLEDIYDDTGY